jgi:hypothetical protein
MVARPLQLSQRFSRKISNYPISPVQISLKARNKSLVLTWRLDTCGDIPKLVALAGVDILSVTAHPSASV